MGRVRVFYLTTTVNTGGAEKHLLCLCRQLRERYRVRVGYIKREGRDSLRGEFEKSGISIGRMGLVKGCDLIHSHLPVADFIGFALSRILGCKWVCTVHNVYYSGHEWRGMWFIRFMFRVWKKADKVIAITGHVKDWLVDNGVEEEKVEVVYYGLEKDWFDRESTAA